MGVSLSLTRNIPEITMKYTVIIEQGRESGYVAHVPALRGCVSQGKTRAEALKSVREAMEAYIEALIEDGLPVPKEEASDTVMVEVSAR
jgi:predicted RNase H-like HicB family nuclease